MSFQTEYALHPVTAVDLVFTSSTGHPRALVGEGLFLKLFDVESGQLLSQRRIFDEQVLHGIAVKKPVSKDGVGLVVAVWGGASFAVIHDLDALMAGEEALTKSSAPDWIMDAAFSEAEEPILALVTAHNALLLTSATAGQKEVMIQTLGSPSRSILYAAHLNWDSASRITVAAGTVFGEIIVWRADLDREQTQTSAANTILYTFTGHEGSIFGVNISPPLQTKDGKDYRLLASCSDDRTVRVWDLTDDEAAVDEKAALGHDHSAPRETGFGENGAETSDAAKRCVAVAMGHISRIWHVKFVLSQTEPQIVNILSFGEDATCQQWVLDTQSLQTPLAHAKTYAFHTGKHIWSAAVQQADKNSVLCVTGGADGNIASYKVPILYELEDGEFDIVPDATKDVWSDEQVFSWSLEEINQQLPSRPDIIVPVPEPPVEEPVEEPIETGEAGEGDAGAKPKKKKKKAPKPQLDAINRYTFVTNDKLLITTSFGRLLMADIGSSTTWRELSLPGPDPQILKSYSIIASIPDSGLGLVAAANGTIFACNQSGEVLEIGKVHGKVAAMFSVPSTSKNSISFLVAILGNPEAVLIDYNVTATKIQNSTQIILPQGFAVTSASQFGRTLLLGSRKGSFAAYEPQRSSEITQFFTPQSDQAPDAITTIIEIPSSKKTENTYNILTTCRNGTFTIFSLSISSSSSIMLAPVHTSTPPFGPLIEAAWFSNNSLYLYGFRSKSFVVWNETLRMETDTVLCGGAHRNFAYSHINEGLGHFAFTKASRLCLHTRRAANHQLLQTGGHGREIKSCAVSDDGSLLATAAEDTCIRLWASPTAEQAKPKCLAVIPTHTAGIQQLLFFRVPSTSQLYLLSSSGNEELFIWAITPIPAYGIGIRCIGSCPPPNKDVRDLRITSFDVREVESEAETKLHITVALSDSRMRIYHWSAAAGFEMIGEGRYTASCLTSVEYLPQSNDRDGLPLVLTAATDGYLGLFSFTKTAEQKLNLTLVQRWKIHQNSIKSLDLQLLPNSSTPSSSSFAVVTGGDDGALTTSIFTTRDSADSSSRTVKLIRSISTITAHIAAVAGLTTWWARDSLGHKVLKIASSSTDQRVKLWGVKGLDTVRNEAETEADDVRSLKLGEVFTAVADVGDVVALPGDEEGRGTKVVVAGVGLEIWRV